MTSVLLHIYRFSKDGDFRYGLNERHIKDARGASFDQLDGLLKQGLIWYKKKFGSRYWFPTTAGSRYAKQILKERGELNESRV